MEEKLLGLKDVLEDNFDVSKNPPRLFVKLSSLDGKLGILTEVKHNSPLTKYFAEQSRNKSPALSSVLDDLYNKAESDSSDSGVALGDLPRKTPDNPELNHAFNTEGQPSSDQFMPQDFPGEYQDVGYDYSHPHTIQQSDQYYHEHNQENNIYHHGTSPEFLERSDPNIRAHPSWYGSPQGPSHYPPPPMVISPYYPMWPYPLYSPYSPAHYPSSPGWPTQFSPQVGHLRGHQQMAAAMPEERDEDQVYTVSHEEWVCQNDATLSDDGCQEQSPSTEPELVAGETSDTSDSSTSSESHQNTPRQKYGYVFASEAGQTGETNFRWVEMTSEDKDIEVEYNQFARESVSSSLQNPWSRVAASRSKRFSGGSGSQLDMISEESNDGEDEQEAASEVSLTISSEVSEDQETLAKEDSNGKMSNMSPITPGALFGSDLISKSLIVMDSARMIQRVALSSKSTTCLSAVKSENQGHDQDSPQPSGVNTNDLVQLVDTAFPLGDETKSCQPLTEKQGVEEAHSDATVNQTSQTPVKSAPASELSVQPTISITDANIELTKSTSGDVLSELNEREQSLLHERAGLEQQLQDMHANVEDARKLWAELECIEAAIQTEQEEFMKKMADLDDEEQQQIKRLDEEKLNWEDKLHKLDTSNYDEITLELNGEDQQLNREVEALKLRQKEVDDMHKSIEMRVKATGLLRERVTQMETETDQCVKDFDEKSQEAEEEVARQKAFLAQRDTIPKRKLSDLRKNIMRLKQELGEVQSSFSQRSESAAQLQSDAVELQQENDQLESRVRSLRSQLPIVLNQFEQYEKTYPKRHGQHNSRSIVQSLVHSQPSVTPTLASASLLFDVTQLELSTSRKPFQPRMGKQKSGSRLS